jgi:uncharacterized membrane protein YtjA (UPF0391 family)
VLGLVSCVYLALPFAGRESAQYVVAGVLLLVGVALFVINLLIERRGAIDTVEPAR